jgi:hypothetical protein
MGIEEPSVTPDALLIVAVSPITENPGYNELAVHVVA